MAIVGQRTDIERRVTQIADRMVRGQYARKNYKIKLYHTKKVLTFVAAALTSIGVSNPLLLLIRGEGDTSVSAALDSFSGLPKIGSIVGVACFIVLAVVFELFRQYKTEETAVQCLQLVDAFNQLKADLDRILDGVEPLPELAKVYDMATALEKSYYRVMPTTEDCQERIKEYARQTIESKCGFWNDSPPGLSVVGLPAARAILGKAQYA